MRKQNLKMGRVRHSERYALTMSQAQIDDLAVATRDANAKIAASLRTYTTGPRAGSAQAHATLEISHREIKRWRRTLIARALNPGAPR